MKSDRQLRKVAYLDGMAEEEIAERGAKTFEACGIILLNAADEIRKNIKDSQQRPVGIIYNFVRVMAMAEDLADVSDLAGSSIKRRNKMPMDIPISKYSDIAPEYHEWLVSYDQDVINERTTLFGGNNQ